VEQRLTATLGSPRKTNRAKRAGLETGGVVWDALMMIIPLAVTLARAYGLSGESRQRATRVHDHSRRVLG
jgi:hypothetical protein